MIFVGPNVLSLACPASNGSRTLSANACGIDSIEGRLKLQVPKVLQMWDSAIFYAYCDTVWHLSL